MLKSAIMFKTLQPMIDIVCDFGCLSWSGV